MADRFPLLMVSSVVPLALAGCATDGAKSAAAPAVHHSLEGGPWTIISFADGSTVPAHVTADITFEPGDHDTSRVYGTGGCNRIDGGWQLKGDKITLGPLASTMMACEPSKMETESKLLAVLNGASTLSWDADGTAKIATADGNWVKLRCAVK